MLIANIFMSAPCRAIMASLALTIPSCFITTTSAMARDELTLVITKVTALDAADSWIAGPDDFYARVTIDGQVFTTKIKRQRNHAEPNWKISKYVRGGPHDVKLEIFDKYIGKGDDKIDINRIDDKRDLDFTVNTRNCRVEGFSERYRCGDPIRREGFERKKAAIDFYVDVNR